MTPRILRRRDLWAEFSSLPILGILGHKDHIKEVYGCTVLGLREIPLGDVSAAPGHSPRGTRAIWLLFLAPAADMLL